MPKNKRETARLSAALIEHAHDVGISAVWPGVEPVEPHTCLNLNLLYSAAEQPYQEFFGIEPYPSIEAKAAYLFIHIATGHLFSNGNKRTATLCLDAFAAMNGLFLTLNNEEIRQLAVSIASYRERRETFDQIMAETQKLLRKNLVPVRFLRRVDMAFYRRVLQRRQGLLRFPLARMDAPLRQRD